MRWLWGRFARWRAAAADRDAGLFMLAALVASTHGDGAVEMQRLANEALERRKRWRRRAGG